MKFPLALVAVAVAACSLLRAGTSDGPVGDGWWRQNAVHPDAGTCRIAAMPVAPDAGLTPPCDCSVVTMDGLPSVAHFDHCPTQQQIEAYEAAHPGGNQFGECSPSRKP